MDSLGERVDNSVVFAAELERLIRAHEADDDGECESCKAEGLRVAHPCESRLLCEKAAEVLAYRASYDARISDARISDARISDVRAGEVGLADPAPTERAGPLGDRPALRRLRTRSI